MIEKIIENAKTGFNNLGKVSGPLVLAASLGLGGCATTNPNSQINPQIQGIQSAQQSGENCNQCNLKHYFTKDDKCEIGVGNTREGPRYTITPKEYFANVNNLVHRANGGNTKDFLNLVTHIGTGLYENTEAFQNSIENCLKEGKDYAVPNKYDLIDVGIVTGALSPFSCMFNDTLDPFQYKTEGKRNPGVVALNLANRVNCKNLIDYKYPLKASGNSILLSLGSYSLPLRLVASIEGLANSLDRTINGNRNINPQSFQRLGEIDSYYRSSPSFPNFNDLVKDSSNAVLPATRRSN